MGDTWPDPPKHWLRLDAWCAAGGYVFRPNFDSAAEKVLRDFRAGLLGRFNLDVDLLKKECVSHCGHNRDVGVETL